MKHKVGNEVLVKVQIVEDGVFGYGLKTPDGILFNAKRDSVIPVPDMTAEEAWKLAIKLRYLDFEDKVELFNLDPDPSREAWLEIMENMSPESVRDKIEEWEAKKHINVGDVVIETSDAGSEYIGVVTQITSAQNSVCIVYTDGSTNITLAKKLKKTGRHIDIAGILKQIGGDE